MSDNTSRTPTSRIPTPNHARSWRRSPQNATGNRQNTQTSPPLSNEADRATTPSARATQPSRESVSSNTPNALSHFQGSRNTTVAGGQFLNTLGHHTNLIVNLNQSGYVPSGEENSPSQGSDPAYASTARDVNRLNELRNRNMQAVMQLPVQRSNEIYERHLLLKGRGFPLWIPEPNKNLSMIYQRKGINIGDVGLVTYSGSFSFLFNICLPADDPINPRVMPEGFAPIDPPIDSGDVRRFTEFKSGSFLGSNSIVKSSEPDENHLSFEAQSSEGAILVMPEGAVSYDYENIPQFRKYIAANLESWYRYANGPRGREAKNGDLRIVIGCDKSTSWGMATMSNLSQERNSRLTLLSKKTEPTDSQSPQLVGYTWEYSGVAEVRAGPDPEEVEELRADDPQPSVKYANQSLFIRTLNPTLAPEIWEKLNRDLGLTHISDVQTEHDFNSRNPATQRNVEGQSTPSSNPKSRQTNHPGRRHDSGIPDDIPVDISQQKDNFDSSLTSEIKEWRFHPSIGLNRYLSEMYPEARMIITEDRDWYSVIREEETELPSDHDLYCRTLEVSDIEYNDGGVLYLKTRNNAWHPSLPEDMHPSVPEDTQEVIARRRRAVRYNKPAGFLPGVYNSISSYFRSALSSPSVADDSQVSITSRIVKAVHPMTSIGYPGGPATIRRISDVMDDVPRKTLTVTNGSDIDKASVDEASVDEASIDEASIDEALNDEASIASFKSKAYSL
ncbi:hypothetical protein CPC08DRAFT_716753 [Agrocybe pediades]|nr:hypothetical protein CPC08DRAFT_716753 [Agrocybe pediades]